MALPKWRCSEGELPIEELARRQGVKPIASIEELAHRPRGLSAELPVLYPEQALTPTGSAR